MQALVRDTVTYKPNEDVTLRLGTDLNITGTDIYAFGSGGPPKEGEPDNNGPATDEAIETEFQSTDAAIGVIHRPRLRDWQSQTHSWATI